MFAFYSVQAAGVEIEELVGLAAFAAEMDVRQEQRADSLRRRRNSFKHPRTCQQLQGFYP